MELTLDEILDSLAWEGCRLFIQGSEAKGWNAQIDRPETGYETWKTETPYPTSSEAVRDAYARFLPHAMGGQDS